MAAGPLWRGNPPPAPPPTSPVGIAGLMAVRVASWAVGRVPPVPRGATLVYAMRHGESEANAARMALFDKAPGGPASSWTCAVDTDTAHRDSPLSVLGIKQATERRPEVAAWAVDAVYISPFTRALQTFGLAFETVVGGDKPPPAFAEPLLGEAFPEIQECQGRPKAALVRDPVLTALPAFSKVDFSAIPQDACWWGAPGEPFGDRIAAVMDKLHRSPYARVAVVSHWWVAREQSVSSVGVLCVLSTCGGLSLRLVVAAASRLSSTAFCPDFVFHRVLAV